MNQLQSKFSVGDIVSQITSNNRVIKNNTVVDVLYRRDKVVLTVANEDGVMSLSDEKNLSLQKELIK